MLFYDVTAFPDMVRPDLGDYRFIGTVYVPSVYDFGFHNDSVPRGRSGVEMRRWWSEGEAKVKTFRLL